MSREHFRRLREQYQSKGLWAATKFDLGEAAIRNLESVLKLGQATVVGVLAGFVAHGVYSGADAMTTTKTVIETIKEHYAIKDSIVGGIMGSVALGTYRNSRIML
jgi:hypothetical protein